MQSPTTEQTAAITTVVIMATVVLAVISYIVLAFLLARVFKKAGIPKWAAWVPIYNYWKLLEMGDQPGFWAIIAYIPYIGVIGAVFVYIAMYHIGKRFGKEGWFVLLGIFVPVVWLIWLGYDDSKWLIDEKPVVATPA